jgi:hypothetical protein
MKNPASGTGRNPALDEWAAGLEDAWKRKLCRRLLSLARECLPGARESLKWSSPAFDLRGPVAWFFCAKVWVHLAFMHGALLDVPPGTWIEGPDSASKAKRSLRFRSGDNLPEALLRDLFAQAKANDKAGRKVDFRIPKPGTVPFDLPEAWRAFLAEEGFLDPYLDRPDYQQRGWIRWIEGAKTRSTREKRAASMLRDLGAGLYMAPKRERR